MQSLPPKRNAARKMRRRRLRHAGQLRPHQHRFQFRQLRPRHLLRPWWHSRQRQLQSLLLRQLRLPLLQRLRPLRLRL